MSTISPALTEPTPPPQALAWLPLPESLYRLSVEQYEAMVASGVFKKRDRIQLINGLLVTKCISSSS
jgi:hypothetical protein